MALGPGEHTGEVRERGLLQFSSARHCAAVCARPANFGGLRSKHVCMRVMAHQEMQLAHRGAGGAAVFGQTEFQLDFLTKPTGLLDLGKCWHPTCRPDPWRCSSLERVGPCHRVAGA